MPANRSNSRTPRARKIGEVAAGLGTTARTLRFYEEQGLVRPARSAQGTRRYSDAEVERFAAILDLARLGIPLKTIRVLAHARPGSASGDDASREVSAQLAALDQAVKDIQQRCGQLRQHIQRADRLVRRCFDCPNPPSQQGCPKCPVAENLHTVPLLALIWDPGTGRHGLGP
ncbi:MAG: hypothetical protein B7Z66_09140 [Chromatiales bacterium 21-64-14]|nr:MAG: hypothetical protein B7Z66_09140 [Chromatiales bacterium 21-64-14]HQU15275.1 MerR family transcriptional regulator [Gammaproteobacteria bacterium]